MFKEKLFIKKEDFSIDKIEEIKQMKGSHHITLPFNERSIDITIVRFYNPFTRSRTKHIIGVLKNEKSKDVNSLYQKLTSTGYASKTSWIKAVQELEDLDFPKSKQIKGELLKIKDKLI